MSATRKFTGRRARIAVVLGIVAGLWSIQGDRRVAGVTVAGIDPLEILDTQVKPNVLFVLDSSVYMASPPSTGSTSGDNWTIGGDDLNSRFYRAKQAMRTVIRENADLINVGLGYFAPDNASKTLSTAGPLVYVSADASASTWAPFFTQVSTVAGAPLAFTSYDGRDAGGAAYPSTCTSCSDPQSYEMFASFNTSENGFSAPYNSRYYIKSRLFRSGIKLSWQRTGSGNPGTLTTDGLLRITSITCPVPPAGLLGDDTTDTNDGAEARPCFQLEDLSRTGTFLSLTTYYYSTGAQTTASTTCAGAMAATVGACAGNGSPAVLDALKLGMPLDNTGTPVGMPNPAPASAPTNLIGFQPNAGNPPIGIQLGSPSALGESLQFALNYYNTSVFPTRPPSVEGKQRNYVILVTAAQQACGVDPVAAAATAYQNAPIGVNQVETIVVVLTSTAQRLALADSIAMAGSGNRRQAFQAHSADELLNAMRAAVQETLYGGEFSDQQSITDSIYEFVDTVSPSASALDPKTRYQFTIPVLFQTTFDMPGFKGHLRAYRNRSMTADAAWNPEAGQKLYNQLSATMGTGSYTFAQLHGGATMANIASSTARIKRRLFTTTRNGVFATAASNPVPDLIDRTAQSMVVPLWPPTTSGTGVAPDANTHPAGSLDTALGIASLSFTDLQNQYGACLGSPLPSDCSNATRQLALARREAREQILAYTAGAEVGRDVNTAPVRDASGNPLFTLRSWVLGESTLASPAVVAPPAQADPLYHIDEYTLFRDGPRTTAATPTAVNGISQGFGLRNPDDDDTTTSKNNNALKPTMTVVYHAANDMLHAFRGGPCIVCPDTGGEELWGFVPYDQLGKLVERMKPQGRTPHTYMLAAPLRVADIWVPGSWSKSVGGVSLSGTGVWRTVLLFGRGIGGKYLTALDVTSPGAFTTTALSTNLPIVLWNRGNPDTNDGAPKSGSNSYANNVADYNAYLRMGQTWSVPAIGMVNPAYNTTTRKTSGVEFVAYAGSGPGTAAIEGTTFYTMDVLTGDVVASVDIGNGLTTYVARNTIVAPPVAFNPGQLTAGVVGSSAGSYTTHVYFGDIHGRLWRMNSETPGSAQLFTDLGPSQPLGVAPALLNYDDGSGSVKPHVYVETGADNRVFPWPGGTPPFRMFGFRDESGSAVPLFNVEFEDGFRGTAQPAAAYNAEGMGRVFFVGTRKSPMANCLNNFDSVLYALTAGSGSAAYSLDSSDPRLLHLDGQKVNAVRVAGGQLTVDMGLIGSAPPPPALPTEVNPPSARADVFSTRFRLGSDVCR